MRNSNLKYALFHFSNLWWLLQYHLLSQHDLPIRLQLFWETRMTVSLQFLVGIVSSCSDSFKMMTIRTHLLPPSPTWSWLLSTVVHFCLVALHLESSLCYTVQITIARCLNGVAKFGFGWAVWSSLRINAYVLDLSNVAMLDTQMYWIFICIPAFNWNTWSARSRWNGSDYWIVKLFCIFFFLFLSLLNHSTLVATRRTATRLHGSLFINFLCLWLNNLQLFAASFVLNY